jgi:hypothetical protein
VSLLGLVLLFGLSVLRCPNHWAFFFLGYNSSPSLLLLLLLLDQNKLITKSNKLKSLKISPRADHPKRSMRNRIYLFSNKLLSQSLQMTK